MVRFRLLLFLGLFLFIFVSPVHAAIEFTIANAQVSDDISVDVDISGLGGTSCLNGRCYLQGMLTATSQNKYFGFTQNNSGSWYEYIGSPESIYIQSTFFYFEPIDGNWSGQLKIKNNPNDPDYNGPGDYTLKVKRYSGSSPTGYYSSNDLTITLSQIMPTPEPTAIPQPSPTPSPSPTPTVKPTASPTVTPRPTASLAASVLAAKTEVESDSEVTIAAEVQATATPSATPQPETKKQGKWSLLMMIGGGGLAVAALFPFLRKWYHDPSWLKTLLKGGDQA